MGTGPNVVPWRVMARDSEPVVELSAAPDRRGPLAVRARAWLEWQGRSVLGKGRLELLRRIDAEGSISAAARAMGVSYRAAWRWVEQMNRAAARPLVRTATGGSGGGGAQLTPLGRLMVASSRRLERRLEAFCQTMSEELASQLEALEQPGEGDEGTAQGRGEGEEP